VYHGGREHQDLLNKAFNLYSIANPLHPDIWPSGMKYESELIAMVATMMSSKSSTESGICGSTTSGGTESIVLATKAHRDFYRNRHNITQPEVVACVSAHAAIDKACDILGIKLIKVPMDPVTFKCDLRAMEWAIGPNTIMLYSSAPQFPQGVIDDIAGISALAVKYNVGQHVDCCLGGFILPFAKKLGYDIPDFDFDLPGVTSMSVDTHKYGYTLKGASVVLYRNKELRHSQYFCYADWTGGMYTTPTIAGSRCTGLITQAWASLVALGEEGFMRNARDIIETAREIGRGVAAIPGLEVIGNVEAMIVCFRATKDGGVNIYTVGDKMTKMGWSLNSLQHPASVHICCTMRHVGKAKVFLQDLTESVQAARNNPGEGGNAAIYGMASSLPQGPVDEMLRLYNDVVYKL
jgi:sphinganine-1-phosphate aldolase